MTEQWTHEQDYALSFGAALGMSARQIAASFGNKTRNSVIGRCYRMGLTLNGHALRVRKPPKEKKPRKPRQPKILWTAEQDAALIDAVKSGHTSNQIGQTLGRSCMAVQARRLALGLEIRRIRFFSEAEDTIIRDDFASFVPVEETAAKLGRSFGTVRQRIFRLGLKRDGRMTVLAKRFGADVLSLSNDPQEIRHSLHIQAQQQKNEQEAAERARISAVVKDMLAAIQAGDDRIVAFKAAMLQGATLQAIGDAVGVTRERVRQITTNPPPVKRIRTVTCVKCSSTFEASGSGYRKFCASCQAVRQIDAFERHRTYTREYHRKLRLTPEWKEYKRNWTRRSRLKEKLKALEPTELATLLRDVADTISSGKAGAA